MKKLYIELLIVEALNTINILSKKVAF